MPVDRSDSGIRVMRFERARRAGADARDTRLPEATRRRRAVPRPDGLPRTVLSAGQLRRLPPSRRAPLVAGMTGRPRRQSELDRRSTSGASRVVGTQPPTGPGHPWWERAAGPSSALDDAADDTLRRPRTPLRTAVRTDEQPGREAAVREQPDHEHPPSWLGGVTSSLRTAGRDRRTPVGERTADSRHRRRRRPARTLGPAAAAARHRRRRSRDRGLGAGHARYRQYTTQRADDRTAGRARLPGARRRYRHRSRRCRGGGRCRRQRPCGDGRQKSDGCSCDGCSRGRRGR